MMPENGTVLDIVKWMRGLTESFGTKRRVNLPTITVSSWFGICKALEDAARRDNKAARDAIYREAEANARKAIAGNAAELRAALERIIKCQCTICPDHGPLGCEAKHLIGLCKLIQSAREILAATPRNCDIGTVEEQADRFLRFCLPRGCVKCKLGDGNRSRFPSCGLAWGQLPYEAPAAQEGGDHAKV